MPLITKCSNWAYKGFNGIMLTLRAESGRDVLTKLDGALVALDKMGATPTTTGPKPNGSNGTPTSGGAAPVCKYHGEMKRSTKFAGWYCSSKMGDGSYCKESVKD